MNEAASLVPRTQVTYIYGQAIRRRAEVEAFRVAKEIERIMPLGGVDVTVRIEDSQSRRQLNYALTHLRQLGMLELVEQIERIG
jgi:hypothetical protein